LEQFHAHFDAARARRHELVKNLDHVHGVLAKGAERARTIGREVLDDVQKACGLR
ncbi:MAG: tryptophan--tRNA ligase, partial [bacterium]|nr:tryptophan--tRNA ligase [bacterium]